MHRRTPTSPGAQANAYLSRFVGAESLGHHAQTFVLRAHGLEDLVLQYGDHRVPASGRGIRHSNLRPRGSETDAQQSDDADDDSAVPHGGPSSSGLTPRAQVIGCATDHAGGGRAAAAKGTEPHVHRGGFRIAQSLAARQQLFERVR